MMDYLVSKLDDPIWLAVTCVVALFVIYYIIQYFRSARNHRDSADDYAKGCLETISLGCLIPFTFIMLLLVVVF